MNQPTNENQWSPPSGPPGGPNSFEMFGAAPGSAQAAQSQTAVRRGPKNLGRMGLAAALVVTAGVGGYAVKSALTEPAGPQTPGEAFEQFFVAVDAEDLAGVLELMPPGERETMVEPTAAVMRELQRLEVFDPAADASSLEGFDLTVEGITYTVDQLDPRLAWVTTTGGTISGSSLDSDLLPFGKVLRDNIDAAEEASGGMTLDEVMAETEGGETDLGDEPFSLAVIEDDGSWYVSLTYTIAESARNDSGKVFPGLGNGPTPVGGATPGDAIKKMIEEAVALDVGGMISYLDPVEMAALYDYSPLFLDDLEAGAQSFTDEVGTLSLDRLDTRSWERNGRTMVGIDGFAGSMSGTDSYTGETFSASVEFDGDCYVATMDGETQELCVSEAAAAAEADAAAESFDDIIDELGIDLSVFEGITTPEQGITVVERDGRWYLSLVPSMMYPVAEILAEFETDAFVDFTDSLRAVAQDGEDAFFDLGNEIMGGSSVQSDPFGDESFADSDSFGTTQNYVVEKTIPAGTPGSVLLSDGYVSVIEVSDEDLDFATVWYLDMEVGGLSALRDIQVGEVLLVDDFG